MNNPCKALNYSKLDKNPLGERNVAAEEVAQELLAEYSGTEVYQMALNARRYDVAQVIIATDASFAPGAPALTLPSNLSRPIPPEEIQAIADVTEALVKRFGDGAVVDISDTAERFIKIDTPPKHLNDLTNAIARRLIPDFISPELALDISEAATEADPRLVREALELGGGMEKRHFTLTGTPLLLDELRDEIGNCCDLLLERGFSHQDVRASFILRDANPEDHASLYQIISASMLRWQARRELASASQPTEIVKPSRSL